MQWKYVVSFDNFCLCLPRLDFSRIKVLKDASLMTIVGRNELFQKSRLRKLCAVIRLSTSSDGSFPTLFLGSFIKLIFKKM